MTARSGFLICELERVSFLLLVQSESIAFLSRDSSVWPCQDDACGCTKRRHVLAFLATLLYNVGFWKVIPTNLNFVRRSCPIYLHKTQQQYKIWSIDSINILARSCSSSLISCTIRDLSNLFYTYHCPPFTWHLIVLKKDLPPFRVTFSSPPVWNPQATRPKAQSDPNLGNSFNLLPWTATIAIAIPTTAWRTFIITTMTLLRLGNVWRLCSAVVVCERNAPNVGCGEFMIRYRWRPIRLEFMELVILFHDLDILKELSLNFVG